VSLRGLSLEDVNKLAIDPSTATRASTAALLAQQVNTQTLKPAELKLAFDIFRIMVRDAEVRVREALSANLKDNPNIPSDVARTLAEDVESVSLPVLAYSEVLTAADLVHIINAQNSIAKMHAIAGRAAVDESVSAALVERGTDKVVAHLMANAGALIAESTLHRAVDRFGESEIVLEPLVQRAVLPITVCERLVNHVADHLRTQLLAKHRVSTDVAIDLVLQTRERATVGLAMGVGEDALSALVMQLKDNGRLTTSLVLRAICMGNLRFFEHALAALASVPLTNTRVLVHEGSGAGLRAIWAKAGLVEKALPAIRAAVDAIDNTALEGASVTPQHYARRILERVLTQYESIGMAIDGDDLEFLLGRIGQPSHGAAPAMH
jgi:uncharacterized protein (DUF2336 family)